MAAGVLDEDRAGREAAAVAAAGRRDRLAILGQLLRLVRLETARRNALVESAVPLPAEVRAEIETGLKRRYGPALAATFCERPELIGGVRIRAGSDLYDGSVRARLATLENSF
jgi:F-type H+-transporting ATPase subunit delta